MAEFELPAFLVALTAWQGRLRGRRITLIVHADSKAALGAIGKFSSPSASCNLLAAEICLLLEKCNVNLLLDHIRTEANLEADALSRLSEGKKIPAALNGLKAAPVPSRESTFRVWRVTR